VGQGVPDLAMLKNVSLEVTVELGRATVTLAQLMGLTIGSVIELDRVAGSPVDIRVNGMLFGRGEVVVVDDEYAVRIVEILSGGLGG
jgi:flagellar motor switch protein FliN